MMELVVTYNGTVTSIYTEEIDLHSLGKITISRASHVEPDETGRWFAQIVSGPMLGPFSKRSEAVVAEIAWLTKYRLFPAEEISGFSESTA